MQFSVEQYAQALREALEGTKSQDHDSVIDSFIRVLQANRDLGKYEAIVGAYEQQDREARGVKQVEVSVARDVEVNKKLLNELNILAGHEAEIKEKIDESLVGGVVIRVDDTLIDASVKAQLANLKEELSNYD